MKYPKLCALLAAFLLLLPGCQRDLPANTVFSGADLLDKTVGIFGGSIVERGVSALSEGTAEIVYYYSGPDMAAALTAGTVDCLVAEDFMKDQILGASRDIRALKDPLLVESYAFAVAKENADLTEDINAVLAALAEDGTLNAVMDGFLYGEGYNYTPQVTEETSRGTLTVAVCPGREPYQYMGAEGALTGLEITLASLVCDRLGCTLNFTEVKEGELLPIVQSGIADFALGCLCDTEENRALVDFSDPYFTSTQVLLVRK